MNINVLTRKDTYEKRKVDIDSWKCPPIVKEDVKNFFKDYELGKITGYVPGGGTLEFYVIYLKLACEFFNKDFKEITEKDLDNFSSALLKNEIRSKHPGNPNYAEPTKKKIRNTLKQFLDWKGVVIKTKSLNIKLRQKQREPDSLTESEIDKLYKGCKTNKERYLIACLYSSGARASEFLNIRHSDIEMPKGDKNFIKLTLREEFSKTKGRTISLHYKNTYEAFRDFINERLKEGMKPEDRIYNSTYFETAKKINSFGKIKVKTKTGEYKYIGRQILDKNIHFHLFRHSAATVLASLYNRNQICYYFGWKLSSPMADIYIKRKEINMDNVDTEVMNTELGTLQNKLIKQEEEMKLKSEQFEIEKKARVELENKVQNIEKDFNDKLKKIFKKQAKELINNNLKKEVVKNG